VYANISGFIVHTVQMPSCYCLNHILVSYWFGFYVCIFCATSLLLCCFYWHYPSELQ